MEFSAAHNFRKAMRNDQVDATGPVEDSYGDRENYHAGTGTDNEFRAPDRWDQDGIVPVSVLKSSGKFSSGRY